MAVWHFKFCIVPRKGLRRALGCIPPLLSEHVASAELPLGTDDPPNYWEGADMSGVVASLRQLFPSADGSVEHNILGDEEQDKIIIYRRGIYCYVDLRNYDRELVTRILSVAHDHSCVVVVIGPGHVIEPDVAALEQYIPGSSAYAFCVDPEGYLVSAGRRLPNLVPISPAPTDFGGRSNIPPKPIPPRSD